MIIGDLNDDESKVLEEAKVQQEIAIMEFGVSNCEDDYFG
jgi:hypothetical protein